MLDSAAPLPAPPAARVDELRRRVWVARLRRGRRGPWYAEVLAAIARGYPGCCYVEIGVEHGVSLAVVAQCCAESHGCDVYDRSRAVPKGTRFWHMSSDDFFERYDGSPPHLIFLDGGHSYVQAHRDFENARRLLAPGGVIALHDTRPRDERDKEFDRCGEVWRVEQEITDEKFTIDTFPGLTLVRPAGVAGAWRGL